ncbi:hypothetical protein Tco_0069292 [Tanacetum coccineum]
MNMALVLMSKAFKLNYSTPTNNNQRISSNPRNRQIAQPSMNMGQDRQMQMVGSNVQNPGVQNVGNQNGLIVVLWITNQNPNGNGNVTQLLIARKEEAGIQLQAEEFDLIADALDLDEIDEGGRTVDQHHETVEETHAYFEPLYNNLAIEVEKSTRSIAS